jgi:hypothetical protein
VGRKIVYAKKHITVITVVRDFHSIKNITFRCRCRLGGRPIFAIAP